MGAAVVSPVSADRQMVGARQSSQPGLASAKFHSGAKPPSPDCGSSFRKALGFLERNRPLRALRHARRAVVEAPEDPDCHLALAIALQGCGCPEDALVHYERAVA